MNTLNVVESIFFAALERDTPEKRAAYLDEACASDENLRRCVERLLAVQPKVGAFMESPAAAFPVTTDHAPLVEKPGTVIGPYKLLQELGEGGFGVVFMAEQTEPVKRRVALKVIKPGMDSKQVTARFEQERQALAMMDHPHIAKVLDGGTTDSGRPYFVMELVKGIPITQFCDDNRLTPRERLELFTQACQAIQHAHQKGVIHRDVKPSNVLVATYDDKPVVKVIDFGVAKAIEQKLTEGTLFTKIGQVIGTLEYMSPEQASLNALDIDTRSDVYALGVLLYELLTGSTPLAKEKFRQAGFAEMLRLIREEEPQRPSDRLSGSAEVLPALATYRKTDSTKLPKLVRGELDWITMKALEKDRSRRYGTATALAEDVGRYLRDESVEACPPSWGYRLGKFVRKHRTALTLATTATTLLLLGVIVSGRQAWRARLAEQAAFLKADEAEEARKISSAAQERLRHTLYASRANLIQAAWNADEVQRALKLLDEQRPGPGETDLRGFEWHYFNRLCRSELRTLVLEQLKDHSFSDLTLSLSPDGAWLAVFGRNAKDKRLSRITVYDLKDGREAWTQQVPPSDFVDGYGWSQDGKRLLAHLRNNEGRPPGSIVRERLVVLQSEKVVGSVPFAEIKTPDEQFTLIKLSPDGRLAAAIIGNFGGFRMGCDVVQTLRVWDADTGKERFVATLKGKYWALNFSSDGRHLQGTGISLEAQAAPTRPKQFSYPRSVGRVDRTLTIWDTTTGKEESKVAGYLPSPTAMYGFEFSPDGKMLARHNAAVGVIELWNVSDGRLWVWPVPNEVEGKLVFSPDGKMLALRPGQTGTIRVWSTLPSTDVVLQDSRRRPTLLHTYKGFFFHPRSGMAFNATGDRLITVDYEGVVKEWQTGIRTPTPLVEVKWSPSGNWPHTAEEEQGLGLPSWPPPPGWTGFVLDRKGKVRFRLPKTEVIHELQISPDSRFIVTVSRSVRRLKVWDASDGRVLLNQELNPIEGPASFQIRFSQDGRWFFAWRVGERIRAWNTPDFKERFQIPALENPHDTVVLDPAMRRMAIRRTLLPSGKPLSEDRPLKEGIAVLELWDTRTGRRVLEASGPSARTSAGLVFSPDGSKVGAVLNGCIRVWDAETGKELPSGGSAGDDQWCQPDNTGRRVVTRWDTNIAYDNVGRNEALFMQVRPKVTGVSIRDVYDGRVLQSLQGAESCDAVTFNQDGKRLAGISRSRASDIGGQVQLWDAETGAELLSLPCDSGGEAGVVWFSPDGNRLHVNRDFTPLIATSWDATPLVEKAKPGQQL